MLNMVWNVNGGGIDSSLIFMNILRSKYDVNGDTILDALIEFKLFSVLNYLIQQNEDCEMSFLLDKELVQIDSAMRMGKECIKWTQSEQS